MVHKIIAAFDDNTVLINKPKTLRRFFFAKPLIHKGRDHKIAYTCRGRACAEKHNPQIRKVAARYTAGRQDT